MIGVAVFRADGTLKSLHGVPSPAAAPAQANNLTGETWHLLPMEAMNSLPVDLAIVKDFYCARIDAGAGDARSRFITDVPGQAQTYEKKEAEARAWTAGDDAAHPERYPFMLAEAVATGQTIAEVRASIMAQVDLLTPIAARIEGARIAAKMSAQAAATIPEIAAAATVDWNAVLED